MANRASTQSVVNVSTNQKFSNDSITEKAQAKQELQKKIEFSGKYQYFYVLKESIDYLIVLNFLLIKYLTTPAYSRKYPLESR